MSPFIIRSAPASPPIVLVLLLTSALSLSACGGSNEETVEFPTQDTANPTEVATAKVDLFDQTLRALNERYEFATTTTSESGETKQVVGRNIGGNTVTISSVGETSIETVGVGTQYWTRIDGGAWEGASTAPAGQDPLNALLEVSQVSVLEDVMSISYPGAALGLDAEWVTAEITILGPSIEIVATAAGVTAHSNLSPAVDLTMIAAPE